MVPRTRIDWVWVVLAVLVVVGLGEKPLLAQGRSRVVLQAFYWDCWNERYKTPDDGSGHWYTYLTLLAPRLREMGVDGIWIPSPCKARNGITGMGYDLFDHYDLGEKFQAGANDKQKATTPTRFGDKDSLLRLIAVAHANGLEVYPDIVLNHMDGGALDPQSPVVNNVSREKLFEYPSFKNHASGGRWRKTQLDFHPSNRPGSAHSYNPDDDWIKQSFGPDICYGGRCSDQHLDDGGNNPMRRGARDWLVWLKQQTDCDGFRFDAVKHYPPEVVEDALYNAMDAGKPEADQRQYFAVGEFIGSISQIDDWANQTNNRCGTFDFPFRDALFNVIANRGLFDMGSLPNFQQHNRLKTVPFINNHDTWRGVYSDSSANGKDDHTQAMKNNDELAAGTIDPDDPRANLAYAAIMAVDGSPQIYYEDLFDNRDKNVRDHADPATQPVRDYVKNLIWCHQKLRFKEGAYAVPFQGSQDLLVLGRRGKALIALNDNGTDAVAPPQAIHSGFAPNTKLHDYSGHVAGDITTNAQGDVTLPAVPRMSYCIWAPAGISGNPELKSRRTTQIFEFADDLGDNDPKSLRYGGTLTNGDFRNAGAVWCAANSRVKVTLLTDEAQDVALRVLHPSGDGAKSDSTGSTTAQGQAGANAPLAKEFTAPSEGYYQLMAKLAFGGANASAHARLVVEYEAPARSTLIK
ncbi:MAG TPA: alpha-amylase family glycosyl hydrolase [Tepidisphaeraceae bacterium]|jgi:alpha-amylase